MRSPFGSRIEVSLLLKFRSTVRACCVLLMGGCLLALSGCAQILPGLNISTASGHEHYEAVKGSHGHYLIKSTQKGLPGYRVIPITANLIAAEAEVHPESANDKLPALKPGAPPPEYRIGPGDVVNVTVWDHPELTLPAGTQSQNAIFNGQLVASDGTMYYPFVGTFKAAGMTAEQLRQYISQHLKTYIQDPQVDVRVVSYQADRVEVTGEVQKPGTITLDNTAKGVLQAIDAAGGLTKDASRRRAILIRHGKRYVINLAGLLSGNRVVPNPVLLPGDSIHIPDQSNDQVFMLGAVNTQAPITIQQNNLTLLQALTEAGGLDPKSSNDSGVLVFRLSGNPKQPASIFTLDLSRAASVFLAGQFRLRPRDVVYVKATDFYKYNSIIAQILPTVTTVFQLAELNHLANQ